MTATLTSVPQIESAIETEQWVLLENISWELYEQLSEQIENQGVRLSYDEGRLWIMAPISNTHDIFKKLIGGMIQELAMEWRVPFVTMGSSTWKRKDLRKALEADDSFYIQHVDQVRGKMEIDLTCDPPPDLAIEVDITHHPLNRAKIYAGLGVNELWRFDGRHMTFNKLGHNGQYHLIERSDAFPALLPVDIERHLAMCSALDHLAVLRSFREWLQNVRR